MSEFPPPPFVDNGQGYPTRKSARAAFAAVGLTRLTDLEVSFRGETGTMVGLVAQCEITHLTKNWPQGFVGQVVGIARQAIEGGRA